MPCPDAKRRAKEHLYEALSAADLGEKQFHVRQAIQLLRVDD